MRVLDWVSEGNRRRGASRSLLQSVVCKGNAGPQILADIAGNGVEARRAQGQAGPRGTLGACQEEYTNAFDTVKDGAATIISLLKGGPPPVAHQAALVLGEWGDPETGQVLAERLKKAIGERSSIAHSCIAALKNLGGTDAVNALHFAAACGQEDFQLDAIESLEELATGGASAGPEDIPLVDGRPTPGFQLNGSMEDGRRLIQELKKISEGTPEPSELVRARISRVIRTLMAAEA